MVLTVNLTFFFQMERVSTTRTMVNGARVALEETLALEQAVSAAVRNHGQTRHAPRGHRRPLARAQHRLLLHTRQQYTR